MTQATFDLIKDDSVYERQGTVKGKGKDKMNIWHITGTCQYGKSLKKPGKNLRKSMQSLMLIQQK
jgi:hypothetical protein